MLHCSIVEDGFMESLRPGGEKNTTRRDGDFFTTVVV